MMIQFDKDLEQLKHMLIDMATTVEKMIHLANRVLLEREDHLIEETYGLEDKVNHLEVEIERYCVTLIARHQPAATDLRLIVSVIQMSNQLERLGDHAINVVKRNKEIAKIPLDLFPSDLKPMVSLATQMVKQAISAFLEHDAGMAKTVCKMDDEVDDLNRKLWKNFIHEMVRAEMDLETGFEMLMASKQYERIGDCATNLAEEIIYYLNGENIKHHFSEEDTRDIPRE